MSKLPLKLCIGDTQKLAIYIAKQLNGLFPSENLEQDIDRVKKLIPNTIERLHPIIDAVHIFKASQFNHLNSLQYSTFLYLLANEYWLANGSDEFADRLFYMNRSLNSIDLFYSVKMPDIFFISHGLGSVIGNAEYGSYFVFFQNVTVGRVGENRPIIEENVIIYPGATITGSSIIGKNSVISAGCFVHNAQIPPDSIVMWEGKEIKIKPRHRDYISLYFKN